MLRAMPIRVLVAVSITSLCVACGGTEQVSSTSGPGTTGGDEELADEVVPVAMSTSESPDCVSTSAFVQQSATGYNHIVQIDNECDQQVRCEVTTDVAPDPVYGRVQPHDRAALTTYRGGMTTTFTPTVSCELQ